MSNVCLYFQVHQPYRLRRYSVFDTDSHYFDDHRNAELLRRIAHKCYIPANQILKEAVQRHQGKFKLAFSMTGTVLEQLESAAPEALDSFKALVDTGHVELLLETYHHSLSFLYSRTEFLEQVDMHRSKVRDIFKYEPKTFRNTELIYSNELAAFVQQTISKVMLAEGVDGVLGSRSPNLLYHPSGLPDARLLLKNYRLSDDIAFRFSDRKWEHWPLTAQKFAGWLKEAKPVDSDQKLVNLFMDYETFGEHQWAETGIFDFLVGLSDAILNDADNRFVTPQEAARELTSSGEVNVPNMTSWADVERDLSAWLGNAMQSNALHELYKLEKAVKDKGDEELLQDWRRLTTSDHFYYMCTKHWADGAVHKYFSPYESPYDSYINFMNVLDNISSRAKGPI